MKAKANGRWAEGKKKREKENSEICHTHNTGPWVPVQVRVGAVRCKWRDDALCQLGEPVRCQRVRQVPAIGFRGVPQWMKEGSALKRSWLQERLRPTVPGRVTSHRGRATVCLRPARSTPAPMANAERYAIRPRDNATLTRHYKNRNYSMYPSRVSKGSEKVWSVGRSGGRASDGRPAALGEAQLVPHRRPRYVPHGQHTSPDGGERWGRGWPSSWRLISSQLFCPHATLGCSRAE